MSYEVLRVKSNNRECVCMTLKYDAKRKDKKNVMVFSVAVNYYDLIFSGNIESQKAYAERYGYDYFCFKGEHLLDIKVAAWLKIALIREYLEMNYELVMFVDADCYVRDNTPNITQLIKREKFIYLAKGFSGRVNTGMMIIKNSIESNAFIQTLLVNCEKHVKEQDWGENGHVIHFCRDLAGLEIVDRRWNNNTSWEMKDYIRHYCGGTTFRSRYPFTKVGRFFYFALIYLLRYRRIRSRLFKLFSVRLKYDLNEQLEFQMKRFRDAVEH